MQQGVANLEQQDHNLQRGVRDMLEGPLDLCVANIGQLKDLASTVDECFGLHAEQIELIKDRVQEIEASQAIILRDLSSATVHLVAHDLCHIMRVQSS